MVAMCPDYEEYAIDLRKMMGQYILCEQLHGRIHCAIGKPGHTPPLISHSVRTIEEYVGELIS